MASGVLRIAIRDGLWHRLAYETMRWRLLFFLSLGLNLALAAGWLVSARRDRAADAVEIVSESRGEPLIRTNVVLRRQFFSWDELESTDYPTYIANLRAIRCPEQTIRDIIIAEINALFAKRLATELVTPEQQWWRSEPDTNVARAAAVKMRELDVERRELLTRLLGPDWETGDMISLPRPSRPGVVLDGPVLGNLPDDVKQRVEDISVRSRERMQQYVDAQAAEGQPLDPAVLAELRKQTRQELASVLTPPQLEEYLLRYSQNAEALRATLRELQYFDATPEEFRAIFRATDNLDQQIEALAGRTDPNSRAQLESLQRQRDQALRTALGQERYEEYMLLHDPLYRAAMASAQEAGTPEAARAIYEINLATAEEFARINANTNLTEQQRAIELQRAHLKRLEANAVAMGQEIPPEEPPVPTPVELPPVPSLRTHPYVLGVGESVVSIAMRYGVTMEQMQAANPNVDLKRLRPGDLVQVPDALQGE